MRVSLVSLPVTDPVKAHEIYTTMIGFSSKEFDPESLIAIVESAEQPHGTAILLEPCGGNFAEQYQKSAFKANLPIMAFSAMDVTKELERLNAVGITLRPELDRPQFGISNVFEDGCGNLIMLEEQQK